MFKRTVLALIGSAFAGFSLYSILVAESWLGVFLGFCGWIVGGLVAVAHLVETKNTIVDTYGGTSTKNSAS